MPLSDTERNLFEDLYFEKSLPIRERYEGELKKLDYSNDTNRYSLHLSVIKDYAKAEMNAQVEALINVLQRVGRHPDEEDFETFAANLAGMKNRFLLCFAGSIWDASFSVAKRSSGAESRPFVPPIGRDYWFVTRTGSPLHE